MTRKNLQELVQSKQTDRSGHIQNYLHGKYEEVNVRDFLEDNGSYDADKFEDGDQPRFFKHQTAENSLETTAPTMQINELFSND